MFKPDKKSLYLYEHPFFMLTDNPDLYTIPTFDSNDLMEEKRVHEMIAGFAVSRGLATSNNSRLEIIPVDNMGDWRYQTQWINMRSLVVPSILAEYHRSIRDQQREPCESYLVDLHTRMGMLRDPLVLNTMVNRVYQSINLVPYPESENEVSREWSDIHQEIPYLWILILLQGLIRTYGVDYGGKSI